MRGSQLLQKMLSCSLLICFLFWDSSIGQFVANTSILGKQLEILIKFSFCDILKNAVIEEGDFVPFHISHSEGNRIAAVIWDKESVWCLVCHRNWRWTTANNQIGDQLPATTGSYPSICEPTKFYRCFTDQTQSNNFFKKLYYQIWEGLNYCRKCCHAAYWSVFFSGIRQSGSLWPTQAYWSNNLEV